MFPIVLVRVRHNEINITFITKADYYENHGQLVDIGPQKLIKVHLDFKYL